jgi:gentisate 1,2-dioxygenase
MAGGKGAPEHLHPCPVLGIINSGEAVFQIEGQEKMILHEGDAFYEPKNVKFFILTMHLQKNPCLYRHLSEGRR